FEPTSRGGTPAYFQRDLVKKHGRQLIAGDEVMPLRCDATVSWIDLKAGAPEKLEIATGHHGYLLALDGAVDAGVKMSAGDGLDVEPGELTVTASTDCAVLWIDAVA
ncbi:MAG: hypothetical protein ACO1OB_31385, partial [Archangium sp.]